MRHDIIIDCLVNKQPYTKAAKRFVNAFVNLPDTPFVFLIKTSICYNVRYATEKILDLDNNPIPEFINILDSNAQILESISGQDVSFTKLNEEIFENVEHKTGSYYGNLFKGFDDEHYFNETLVLLKTRLERNNFDFKFVKGKTALDQGCGGGRYTVALKNLGLSKVVGLDCSETGIMDAKERLKLYDIENVFFDVGSVLEMKYDDNYFDFVFSNGVLHHTLSIEKGIKELIRVLKPNGKGWLYLINKPGGIFWDMVEVLRPMMKNVPYNFVRESFRIMGVPTNKIFHILDHIMVPINVRLTSSEIINMLAKHGAIDIVRLERGTDFDFTERIFQKVPYAEEKYGSGEHRYFFSKR